MPQSSNASPAHSASGALTVTSTHADRGTVRTEVTDAQGRFRFVQLPPGNYRLEAALWEGPRFARVQRVETEKAAPGEAAWPYDAEFRRER